MKLLITLILVLLKFSIGAQNYNNYHSLINKAETFFFINKDIDSCLYYYDKAFNDYNYNFVRDLINAAQISFYSNKPYKHYIFKGFEFGLKINHLKRIPLFSEIYNDFKQDTVVIHKYTNGRSIYLKEINFTYLYKMYDFAMKDQVSKNKRENTDYNYLLLINTYIDKYGFPGEKILGIADPNIFYELGKPNFDLAKLKEKKYKGKIDYYNVSGKELSNNYGLIILIHIQYAFYNLENKFKIAVEKGEIHPRDVGMLYDNMYRTGVQNQRKIKTKKGVFLLNEFCNYKHYEYTKDQVDILRKNWNIVPIDVDKIKREFEIERGFKLFWGVFEKSFR